MTIGEQIVLIHFGKSAQLFSDLARDIDAALADKDMVVKSISEECDKLRTAANLIIKRKSMVSGSLAMAECDAYCNSLGLATWGMG